MTGPRPRSRGGEQGSALVEALVAVVLAAVAAATVASAAVAGLRATRRAATFEELTALAARELDRLASRGAGAAGGEATGSVPGIPGLVHQTTDARRDGRVLMVTARVDGGRPPESVALATRVLLPP